MTAPKLKNKLRDIWHDLYYAISGPRGELFAMSCKEATARVDLGTHSLSFVEKIRLYLHLSVCHACSRYTRASQALRQLIREYAHRRESTKDIENLNSHLLRKFTQSK